MRNDECGMRKSEFRGQESEVGSPKTKRSFEDKCVTKQSLGTRLEAGALTGHSERFERRLVDGAGGLEILGCLKSGQGFLGLRADQAVDFSLI